MGFHEEALEYGLSAPLAFFDVDEGSLAMLIGGCGPGQKGDLVVPDTILGVNIRIACAIHDFDYLIQTPKKEADERFRLNLLAIVRIESDSPTALWLREHMVSLYYWAVSNLGASSYKKAGWV